MKLISFTFAAISTIAAVSAKPFRLAVLTAKERHFIISSFSSPAEKFIFTEKGVVAGFEQDREGILYIKNGEVTARLGFIDGIMHLGPDIPGTPVPIENDKLAGMNFLLCEVKLDPIQMDPRQIYVKGWFKGSRPFDDMSCAVASIVVEPHSEADGSSKFYVEVPHA